MIVLTHNSPERCQQTVRRCMHVGMKIGWLCLCAALLSMSYVHNASAQTDNSKKNTKKDTSKTEVQPPRRVLIFPADAKGGGASEQIADDISEVENTRLTATHTYEPINFLSSIPTIKLALKDQTLTPGDVKHPYDNDTKLKKLSGVSGYDLVMVTSIDDYEYDAVKNQVNLVMSVRLIDYSGAKAVVRTAGASASSPVNPAGNVSEYKMAAATARTLTDKLMNDILNPKPATKPAPPADSK